MEYKNHVNDIKKDGIVHLVIIPIILVIFGSLIGGSTDIASLTGMIGMGITIFIFPLIMAKVGSFKLKTLGITKDNLGKNIIKGTLGE